MSFNWESGDIKKDGTHVDNEHLNEAQEHSKELEDKFHWYSLGDDDFSWNDDPISSEGNFIDVDDWKNVRDAVDLLDDNKKCDYDCGNDNSSENDGYHSSNEDVDNSSDHGTIKSTANSDKSANEGSDNSLEKNDNTFEDGSVNGTYDSGGYS